MRFSTPRMTPSDVATPMAVEPSLIASREYSTWKRRPSGEKVLEGRGQSRGRAHRVLNKHAFCMLWLEEVAETVRLVGATYLIPRSIQHGRKVMRRLVKPDRGEHRLTVFRSCHKHLGCGGIGWTCGGNLDDREKRLLSGWVRESFHSFTASQFHTFTVSRCCSGKHTDDAALLDEVGPTPVTL